MTRTRRFLDAVCLNYGNQAVVMLIGLWLTPFLLHHLGQRDYGLWLVGFQSLTYLAVLDIGIIGILPREVAYASGVESRSGEEGRIRRLIEDNAVIVLWQLPILIAALAAVALWISLFHPSLTYVFGIVLSAYALQFTLRIFQAALEGLQDFAFLGYLQMVAWLIGVGVNVLAVSAGYGLLGLAVGWSVTQLLLASACVARMYSSFRPMSPRRLRWLPFRTMAGYLRSSFWVSVAQVTQMLVKGTDVVILAHARGASSVVPYSCSSKLQMTLANQPQVILHAAQSGLTQLRASADHTRLARVIGALSQAMLMMSGAAACLILAVNGAFVSRWVGPSQYLGVWFTVVISISMLVRHLNATTVYTLFCFRKERFIAITGLCEGVGFVTLTALLVGACGPLAPAIAALLCPCITSLPWNLSMLKNCTGLSIREQLAPVLQWFLPFVVVAPVITLLSYKLAQPLYIWCAAAATLAVLLYLLSELHVIRTSPWSAPIRDQVSKLWWRIEGLSKVSISAQGAKPVDPASLP